MNTEFFGAQLGERSASTTGGVSVLIRQLLGRAICCQNADYRRQAVPLRSSRCLNKQPGEPSLPSLRQTSTDYRVRALNVICRQNADIANV